MSQNFTQPEEIDRVLMEMKWHDLEAGTPDGALPNSSMRDTGHDGFATAAGFSYGVARNKSARSLSDP